MTRSTRMILSAAVGLCLPAGVALAQEAGSCCSGDEAQFISTQDQARSAEELLAAYRAVEMPRYDPSKRGDQAYVREYVQKQNAATQERARIGREFLLAYPDHAQAPQIAVETVQALMRQPAEARELIATLLESGKISKELEPQLKLMDVSAMMMVDRNDTDAAWEAVQKLLAEYPGQEQVGAMMGRIADATTGEKRIERLKATLEAFPDSRATKYTAGKIRQAESVGKPFELAFTDALSGEQITNEDLKGKVVVIDFWATWCGPCIAEMPTMKKLYAEYKDKGVEFVGISLDRAEVDGGKDALLKYCKENEITWPQYYQGAFWDGEFSTAWGINSIPAVFILDADGNLHSTNARGKLETLIPELIAKRDGGGAETASAE